MTQDGITKLPSRKRARNVLVCNNCKEKKLRCDKRTPCAGCAKRGLDCVYSIPPGSISTDSEEEQASILTRAKSKTILDESIPNFQLMTVIDKPGRTEATSFALQGSTIKCLMEFKHMLQPKKHWKKSHRKAQHSLSEIYLKDPNGLPNIIDEINQYVTPNYFAIVERLRYFQIHLNKLVFDSCIPCDLLYTVFHTYFQFTDHQFVFIHPVKDYQYQYLALLFAIVDITITFTALDPSVTFTHPLDSNEDFLSHLALKCITYSRHDKRQTVIALYAIVAVRASLWIYGYNQNSSIENNNAYPMFQKAMTLALNICLHRVDTNYECLDFSKGNMFDDMFYTSDIPIECLKRLWNYLLVCDAKYGIRGTPLYIDLEYCHGYHHDIIGDGKYTDQYVKLTRKLSETLFSVESTSYNDLYKLCEEFKEFTKIQISFDNLLKFRNSPTEWKAVNLKLDTLKSLVVLSGYGCKLSHEKWVKQNFTEKQLSDTESYLLFTEFHDYMKQTFFMTYILVLKFINDIIEADFPVEFYLTVQEVFRDWYSRPTIAAVDFLLLEDNKNENEKMKITPGLNMIEDALFGNIKNKNKFHDIVRYSTDPSSVFDEVSKTYKRLFRLQCYQGNYNFLIFSMICWVLIYFIKALLELRNFPQMNFKERTAKLVELAKLELESHKSELQNDYLDLIDIDSFLNNETEMDSLVHSFFGEDLSLSPPRDFNSYYARQ